MKVRILVMAAALALLMAPTAWATGVAAGIGPNAETQHNGTVDGIDIVHTFYIDPNGPPWTKWIDIEIPPGGLQPGTVIPLHEQLIIVPPPPGIPIVPLWDWHEIIHTPGWEWALPDPIIPPPSLIVHNRIDPNTNMPIEVIGEIGTIFDPMNPTAVNNGVWFDPIVPHPIPIPGDPLDIWIWKALVYRGPFIPPDPSGIPTFTQLHLWEHPTIPEPSTFLLAGIGIVGLGMYGSRRLRRKP